LEKGENIHEQPGAGFMDACSRALPLSTYIPPAGKKKIYGGKSSGDHVAHFLFRAL
jgi:hypothetical protein